MIPLPDLVTVSAVAFLKGNSVLGVRKHNTHMFQLPGGKPEPGETALDAALREVREEIGLDLGPEQLLEAGQWTGTPANADAHRMEATVFVAVPGGEQFGQPTVQAEIAELRWLNLQTVSEEAHVAPLIKQYLAPLILDGEAHLQL